MSWRVARSLLTLRAEVDALWPDRDRSSDGTIGDTPHAGRGSGSDHNPWIIDARGVGVVRALDLDEDLAPDRPDVMVIAEHLRRLGAAGDQRLADWGYVIYEGRIAGGNPARGPGRWDWRPYTGVNSHSHHMHVSVSRSAAGYDSAVPWGIAALYDTRPPTSEDLDMDETRLRQIIREELTRHHGPLDAKGPLLPRLRDAIADIDRRTRDLVTGARPGKRA